MAEWTIDNIEKLNDNIHKNIKEIIVNLDNKFSKKSIMMKITRLGLHDIYFKYESYRTCKVSKVWLLNHYSQNPKICKCCNEIINYELRNINDFCDSSCSGKFNSRYRIGLKYKLSEKGLDNLKTSAYNNFHKNRILKEEIYNLCKNCGTNTKYRYYCNTKCWSDFIFKSKPEYEKYKLLTKFKFGLSDYPDKFDFTLIEQYGWYSPGNSEKPNPNGISRDHMYSVKDGFTNNVDPSIISHPANCELMPHTDNQKKKAKSSITLEDLLERIKIW